MTYQPTATEAAAYAYLNERGIYDAQTPMTRTWYRHAVILHRILVSIPAPASATEDALRRIGALVLETEAKIATT